MSVSSWLRSSTVNRRKFIGQAGVMSAVLATAACASPSEVVVTQTVTPGRPTNTQVTVPSSSGPTTAATAAQTSGTAARIIAAPAFGTADVAPTAPITITAFAGKITDLAVTASDGTAVKGAVDAAGTTWTLGERLKYGQTYTFAGSLVDNAGAATPITGQLSTVNPSSTIDTTWIIQNGDTFGVGQPIAIYFQGQVANQANAEKVLTVTTDKGDIEGSWGWLQDEDIQQKGKLQSQVHFRPKEFWPANTKVTVNANLYGVDLGNGNWGSEDVEKNFSIGRQLIATADVTTFRLRVSQDGNQIRDYPVSYGKGDGDRATKSGTHLVQGKYPDYDMCNAAFNYCGVKVTWAVRINDNGEFIHENDSTIASQGIRNVSHGCVNMSTANAKDFYDLCILGDVVNVSNTGQQMSEADSIYDWTYSWQQWQGLSAL